jgi:hypothetical protein
MAKESAVNYWKYQSIIVSETKETGKNNYYWLSGTSSLDVSINTAHSEAGTHVPRTPPLNTAAVH